MLGPIALAALTLILIRPFLSWPADPHLGVFFRWPYFRPGEPVPQQLIRGNQGFSRIYLYTLAELLLRVLGKGRLALKVCLVQALFLWLTAVALAQVALLAGLSPVGAYGAAALCLFLSTRPQFCFMCYNAEPHYTLCAALGVAGLMASLATASSAGSGESVALAGASVLLLAFAGINTKIIFLLDAGLLGLTTLLLTGWPWDAFFAMLAAGLAGIAAFVLIYRRYLARDSVNQLVGYAKWATQHNTRSFYREIYETQVRGTPLPATLLLALGGLPALWQAQNHGAGVLACVWLASSVILLALQFRLAHYQFLLVFPPLALAAGALLDAAWGYSPLALAGLLLAYALAGRGFLADALSYYRKRPLAEHLRRALGDAYFSHFDLRLEDLVREHNTHPGPFLAWGVVPQAHLLADEAPHTYVGVFRALAYRAFPGHRAVLIQALTGVRHEWLYDMSWREGGEDGFNPLATYGGLGLAYVPVKRSDNVVHYRLERSEQGWPANPDTDFFVAAGQSADALAQELGFPGARPPFCPEGLDYTLPGLGRELVAGGGTGRWKGLSEPVEALCAARAADPRPLLARLYLPLLRTLAGDREGAALALAGWRANPGPYPELSPAVPLAEWLLASHLALNPGPIPLDGADLNRVSMAEALGVARLLSALCLAEQDGDAARILAGVRVPATDHQARDLAREMRLLLALNHGSTRLAEAILQGRTLILRMAPMPMLAALVRGLAPSAPRLSLAVQAGAAQEAGGLHAFEQLHPLPDGPFRWSAQGEALARKLGAAGYDCCILVAREGVEACSGPLAQLLRTMRESGGPARVFVYTLHNHAQGTLTPLDPES